MPRNSLTNIDNTKYIPYDVLINNDAFQSILLTMFTNQLVITYDITEYTNESLEDGEYDKKHGPSPIEFIVSCENYLHSNMKGFWSFNKNPLIPGFELSHEWFFYFALEEDLQKFKREHLILEKLSDSDIETD